MHYCDLVTKQKIINIIGKTSKNIVQTVYQPLQQAKALRRSIFKRAFEVGLARTKRQTIPVDQIVCRDKTFSIEG